MSIKIIYRPVRPTDKQGFLKIRIIENRKTKIKSLGIKITGSNWLEGKQQVSKAEPNHIAINKKIAETLRELNQYDTPSLAIKTSTDTILGFYDSIIQMTINQGTKTKYRDVRNRFEAYLSSVGLNDLPLKHLDYTYVQGFFNFMRMNGCAVNTANYNIKSFKIIIKKAIDADLIFYVKNPFALITLKFQETKHKFLTVEEVQRIKNTTYEETRKKRYNSIDVTLREVANTFLFQIFAQGMRVSDIQLLKWGNFIIEGHTIKIDYTQFKTNKQISLTVTPIALELLTMKLSDFNPIFLETITVIKNKLTQLGVKNKELETKENELKVQLILDEGLKHKNLDLYNKRSVERITNENQVLMGRLSVDGGIEKATRDLYTAYAMVITEIKQEFANEYVFYFFKNDAVMNGYKAGALMSDKEYKRLQGKRTYYNKLLKEIQRQTEISTTITSHLARHTYTQLLLNANADVMAVSKALGHSHLSTTQTYISQFPDKRLVSINDSLSKAFS